MRTSLTLLFIVHGLIHILGFLKAYDVIELKELSMPISKLAGSLWLLSGVLVCWTAVLYYQDHPNFWVLSVVAFIASQSMIMLYWADAKSGTLVNLILLIVTFISYSQFKFESKFHQDKAAYIENVQTDNELLLNKDLMHLPLPVQKYLRYVDVVNKPKPIAFEVEFDGMMRNKDSDWFSFTSEQYNNVVDPARFFFMKGAFNKISTHGYHRYLNDSASMEIKLLSVLPVVHEIDLFRAETVTLFNDMCIMAPATLVDKRIEWTELDALNSKAHFTNKDVSITATLQFNEQGQLVNFFSDDRSDTGTASQVRFSTPVSNYQNINGYKLAHYGEAIWHYPEGDFVYGKFNLRTVNYH